LFEQNTAWLHLQQNVLVHLNCSIRHPLTKSINLIAINQLDPEIAQKIQLKLFVGNAHSEVALQQRKLKE